MQGLSWKEQLASSADCVEIKNNAELLAGSASWSLTLKDLLQDLTANEYILKSTIFEKRRPTGPLQTTVGTLPKEDSPCIVRLATLATVIFRSRTWSPGKNTIVVLEVKYKAASCAYSVSVAQWVESRGHDEHEVAVGVTQYTSSAEQQGRLLTSSAATRTRNSGVLGIMCWNNCKKKIMLLQLLTPKQKHDYNLAITKKKRTRLELYCMPHRLLSED